VTERKVGKVPELAAPFGKSPRPTTGDPYNSTATLALGDVVEWNVPDTIEVITLCENSES
jgi:hypothetical protein